MFVFIWWVDVMAYYIFELLVFCFKNLKWICYVSYVRCICSHICYLNFRSTFRIFEVIYVKDLILQV